MIERVFTFSVSDVKNISLCIPTDAFHGVLMTRLSELQLLYLTQASVAMSQVREREQPPKPVNIGLVFLSKTW